MTWATTAAAAVLAVVLPTAQAHIGNTSQVLTHFSFGSCNDQAKHQMLWPTITAQDPQLWLWLGDNIYGDVRVWDRTTLTKGVFRNASPEILRAKYETQLNHPDYKVFRERFPTIGIWDDHDYGINDGCKTYPYRKESQQLFLDFLDEPANSPRRQQEGIYTSYEYGTGDQRVKFILLDNRYHKDPYGTKDGDFLGSAQWTWLEEELRSSTSTFNVIAVGIQVLPGDRWYNIGENWGRFPGARTRLLDLVQTSHASGVILLSGDIHFAEINQVQCGDYKLTEISSSGMTHAWKVMNMRLTGVVESAFTLANMILPWHYRVHPEQYYANFNFGNFDIDWTASPPTATVSVLGKDGLVKLQQVIPATRYEGNRAHCGAIHEVDPTQFFLQKVLVGVVLVAFIGSVLINLVVIVVLPLQLLWRAVTGLPAAKVKRV
ncbi:Aste57867_14208 [Aphanomyces stellatus]|uniref:Aste57867_14208 protein n=1 Tax=Aphanomyces stellatus TaxID=120398 RepID=A0A485L0N5_9STRA|nr:hypothetical protein As57867_014157 [Aphanomyces stellatus]VFT91033.1 Aste57867_14208 [Aphanomyces stellatus]